MLHSSILIYAFWLYLMNCTFQVKKSKKCYYQKYVYYSKNSFKNVTKYDVNYHNEYHSFILQSKQDLLINYAIVIIHYSI